MSTLTVKDLFANGVHIGHRTQKWNPRMKRFIYGEMDGIHIINLEKTLHYLEQALSFVNSLAKEGRVILFVSTKPQAAGIVEEAAKKSGMPYVVSKWIPGLITNFSTLKTRIKYLSDLKAQEASGELAKYTKKEIARLRKVIDKLQAALGGVESMHSLPDAVFVLDTVRDAIVVEEARKAGIPVIGIIDTNSDPTVVDYPIPGNDDALKSLQLFVNPVVEAIVSSRKSK